MSTASVMTRYRARQANTIRRALRREALRLRDRRRIAAMALLILVFALASAGMWARGDVAGSDARAYWAAVRLWLDGGDPYHPTGPFLPYVYSPWMLPLFIPWAMLPWEVAWFTWRGATLLLLLWSIRWAYARRPLPTAILIAILAVPMGASIDTGNINLLLAVALFGAHFVDGRVGGLIWGLATWMKWVPAVVWPVLPPKARGFGLLWLALAGLPSLAMLPLTIVQLQALFGFGDRPVRADYLVFIWSTVPWWWRLAHPFAFLHASAWAAAWARFRKRARPWARAFREAPGPTTARARHRLAVGTSRFLGLTPAAEPPHRRRPPVAERRSIQIGD
ncbi:MAG TPA: glycosyltransferase family 87 protein [Candidatus Limnocylindrales bacterium]